MIGSLFLQLNRSLKLIDSFRFGSACIYRRFCPADARPGRIHVPYSSLVAKMGTCIETKQECLKLEIYLTENKMFDADPDIVSIANARLLSTDADYGIGRHRSE